MKGRRRTSSCCARSSSRVVFVASSAAMRNAASEAACRSADSVFARSCEERDYKGLHAFPSNITRHDPPIKRDCPPSLLILQGRPLTLRMALQPEALALPPPRGDPACRPVAAVAATAAAPRRAGAVDSSCSSSLRSAASRSERCAGEALRGNPEQRQQKQNACASEGSY